MAKKGFADLRPQAGTKEQQQATYYDIHLQAVSPIHTKMLGGSGATGLGHGWWCGDSEFWGDSRERDVLAGARCALERVVG